MRPVDAAREPHRPLLDARGIPPPAAAALSGYLDLVARWSRRVNLTAARTPAERVAVLVEPALAAAPHALPGRLLDVGSGNGSPGLVLALLRPELAVTLLEPRQRRWAFLREAVRVAGRPDVQVLRQRHDEFTGGPADTVTVRALSLPLGELLPLLRVEGRLLVLGASPAPVPGWELEPPAAPGLHRLRRRA